MLPRLNLWLCALILICLFALHAGALPEPTVALRLRQDNPPGSSPPPPPPQPSSTGRDQPPSSTSITTSDGSTTAASSTPASSDTRDPPSSSSGTASPSDTPTSTTLQTSTTAGPTSTVADSPTPSDPTPSKDTSNPLPIVPTITPALGIAGVILIIFGGALSFIGVRSKWLFIFESTAFLVALAIVVLLVYVANPSVSDAVQGAYFVAAFVPACIIGGLSLIFKDLVEGLGCLLGGFCLAMWFLVLKDGGLITSTGGRTGFIVGFAAAGYSLSFSRYTRTYGLIACLSFAGATALILGIDCFSRVGLKEFWLYIWNLNSNTFPLGTSTYPVTRGIKVEIACIIILAVFGAMSQMKLWKIIREKRQKRAAARAQDQEDREHLEADLGRQLEDRNNKELKQWEATYGSKGADASVSAFTTTEGSMHDSCYHSNAPSVKKMSLSLKDSSKDFVEMTDMSGISKAQGKASRRGSRDVPTVNVFEDGDAGVPESPAGRHSNSEALRALETVKEGDSPGPSRPMSYVIKSDDDEGQWVPKSSPGPEVTPLPFVVPSHDKPNPQEDDVKSIATAGDEIRDLDEGRPAPFPRQSLPRVTNKRTSGAVSVQDENEDDATFIIPHNDDARSSIAATIDGLSEDGHSDLPALSRAGTPLPMAEKQPEGEVYTLRKVHSASSLKETVPRPALTTPEPDDTNRRHSVQLGQLVPESNLGSLANLPGPRKEPSDKSSETTAKLKRLSEDSKVNSARARAPSQPTGLTKDALPEGQSSTVLLYRTNEWAKHQAVAEALHPDEVAPPSEGGVAVAYGAEASAPVDIAALQHTAFTEQAPSISREPSQIASNNPYKKHSHVKRNSGGEKELLSRNNSSTSINRNSSQTSLNRPHVARAPSGAGMSPTSPYGSRTIAETPIEEIPTQSSHNLARARSSAAMSSTNTLMGRRQSMLNGRMSSMSFASPDAPTHSMVGLQQIAEQPVGPSDSASSLGHVDDNASLGSRRQQLANDEDMTLAQRKQALKQGQGKMQRSPSALASANPYRSYTPQPQLQRSVSQQYASPSNQMMASNSRLIYDSHQPQRGATVTAATRETRLASWRASVAQDATTGGKVAASNQAAAMDDSRARIIDEQRRAGEAKMAKELEKNRRDSQIDLRMRSGDMVALHREKMRKLQRQASQHQ